MSTMNYDVATIRSLRPWRWNEFTPAAIARSSPFASRDLIAVIVFSAIGLLASLLFVPFVPDGLLVLLAQIP